MAKRSQGTWMCYGLPGKQDWGVGNRAVEIVPCVLTEANARFIATAPEMVAKLIELHAFIVDQYGESKEAEELASLIAKAEMSKEV